MKDVSDRLSVRNAAGKLFQVTGPLRNFGCQWTSVLLEHGGRPWCQTVAVDGLEEWPLVDNTRSGTTTPNHADTCRPAWQFWKQFAGRPETNADHSTRVWCVQFSECRWLNEQRVLDRLQVLLYIVTYTNQKTVVIVQADSDESVYERLNDKGNVLFQ